MNRLLPAAVLALSLAGCAARSRSTTDDTRAAPPPPAASSSAAAPAPAQGEEDEAEGHATLSADPIYFALDSATLTPQSQATLEQLAEALRRRPRATVTVAGHTCELGTTEYNLALGQRRAAIVQGHLVRLGVEARRISTVSYGEERPLDEGAGEEARTRNRRADFSFHAGAQAVRGEP